MDTVLATPRLDEVSAHPLISWRSMIAGLLVALFSYMILIAAGVAVGGTSLIDGLQADAQSAGLMTGAWVMVSAALSLALGSYFAARVSKYAAPLVGSAQAVVIAALFFGLMTLQMMTAIGLMGRAVGSIAGAAGQGMSSMASSTVVADAVDSSLQGLDLKAPPATVAEGVTTRLLQGNPEAARDYLARQSGVAPAELQERINVLQTQVQTAVADAGSKAARALAATAWSLLAMMIVGLIGSVLGGFWGARENVRVPLARMETGRRTTMRPATV